MTRIINYRRNFDRENREVILCDEALEKALNVRALHRSELLDMIGKQLVPENDPNAQESFRHTLRIQNTTFFQPQEHINGRDYYVPNLADDSLVPFNTDIDGSTRYRLKSALFMGLMRTYGGLNATREIFTYAELSRSLSLYIQNFEHQLIDPRNKLMLITNEPLQVVFKVRAFHRTQLVKYFRNLLIPLDVNELAIVEAGNSW